MTLIFKSFWISITVFICCVFTGASSLARINILMWQVPPWTSEVNLSYLASKGVTLTQSFAMLKASDTEILLHLTKLQKYGMRSVFWIGPPKGVGSKCHFSDRSIDFIRRHKGNLTIAAWHILDEAAEHGHNKACQRALYQSVKQVDPSRPIMQSINYTTEAMFREYFSEDAFDILEVHAYVNPHPNLRQQRQLSLLKKYKTKNYNVIVTLRAFNSTTKKRRIKMVANSFCEQYQQLIEESDFQSIGFYGWDLSPNEGLNKVEYIRKDFDRFMAWHNSTIIQCNRHVCGLAGYLSCQRFDRK
jgi:hypothetical protein